MQKILLTSLLPLHFLTLQAVVYAQAPAPVQAGHPNRDLAAGFAGKWVGQLEYRDFGDGSRVFLPAWLTMTGQGNTLRLQYVYDDGPAKTVREALTVQIDAPGGAVTLTSEGDRAADRYTAEGLSEFAKLGRGVLKLSGTGAENGKKVDVRITLTLRRNLFLFLKETRLPGEDFKFRDQYTMTRAEEPKATP